MRWRVAHHTVGYGHLYQARFKSFPVQRNEHFLTVCRYVERNALAAGIVRRAEHWRWGSLWARDHGAQELRAVLADWPVDRPDDWVEWVNRPLGEKELERMRMSLARGRPLGDEDWVSRTVSRLHMEHTVRAEGRPRREAEAAGSNAGGEN